MCGIMPGVISETLKFKMAVLIRKKGRWNVANYFLQIYMASPILFTPGGM
jgi:hypothetical protein